MNRICKKCGNTIPWQVKINDEIKDLTTRRYCLKCSPYGDANRKRLKNYKTEHGIDFKFCIGCKDWKEILNFIYIKKRNLTSSFCKDCFQQDTKRRRRERKVQAIKYKGDKCIDCGGQFHPNIYDFHHLDPTIKDLKINEGMAASWEKLKIELDKCVLLCSNCHRLRHTD